MNICAMIGNVASEPQLHESASGKSICTFTLAVTRATGDKADTFTIAAWDRQAEVCHEYLHVGRRVSVEGRLRHVERGSDAGSVQVVAHRVELLARTDRT